MESLDPHLCNNAGLVTRLVDWEESWELGQRYITNAGLLNALGDLVSFILEAQTLEPTLAQMCEDCDVELFLVLPRLFTLRCLLAPESQIDLLKEFLPHRFDDLHSQEAPVQYRTLPKLREEFERIQIALGSEARETLMRAAVGGFDCDRKAGTLLNKIVGRQLEKFMRELEEWSIEVQRHRAEDWNQCSAIVVRCLAGNSRSPDRREQLLFEV
jgi:hypothetical protein